MIKNSKKIQPPMHKGNWFSGSYRDLIAQPHEFYSKAAWQNNDGIARFRIFNKVFVVVAHPDFLHHILVTNYDNYRKSKLYKNLELLIAKGILTESNEEKWKEKRQIGASVFHKKAVFNTINLINSVVEDRLKHWTHKNSENTLTIDVDLAMRDITQLIIMDIITGYRSSPEKSKFFSERLSEAGRLIIKKNWQIISLPASWPSPINNKLRSYRQDVLNHLNEIIEERERLGIGVRQDLLDLLFTAYQGRRDFKSLIANDLVTMFLAGYDTTSSGLAWALYYLSIHPEYQAVIQNEVDDVWNKDQITSDDISHLKYTGYVFDEALRLHAPIHTISRSNIEDDCIGGYHIPKNSQILMSLHGSNRSPLFWDNPNEFIPKRFDADWNKNLNRKAFVPYSSGKRSCQGALLASLEGKLVLANVMRMYNIQPITTTLPKSNKGTINYPLGLKLELIPRYGA
jgi:cytochrome P450